MTMTIVATKTIIGVHRGEDWKRRRQRFGLRCTEVAPGTMDGMSVAIVAVRIPLRITAAIGAVSGAALLVPDMVAAIPADFMEASMAVGIHFKGVMYHASRANRGVSVTVALEDTRATRGVSVTVALEGTRVNRELWLEVALKGTRATTDMVVAVDLVFTPVIMVEAVVRIEVALEDTRPNPSLLAVTDIVVTAAVILVLVVGMERHGRRRAGRRCHGERCRDVLEYSCLRGWILAEALYVIELLLVRGCVCCCFES